MPFRVHFSIFEPGKLAPYFETDNRALAHVEYNSIRQKTGYEMTRMKTDITPYNLTGPEIFLYLAYRMRQSQKRYWANKGRVDKETEQGYLKEATGLEKKLDLKIADTRFYLNGHPKCTPSDKKALEFFLLVEACREKQKYYFRYKRQKDFDQEVANKIKQECKDYEKQIDEYCRKKIGL